jgi:hypothetical protein
MDRITSYVAGVVTTLALITGALAGVMAATASPNTPLSKPDFVYPTVMDWTTTEISEQFGVGITYFEDSPCGDTSHMLGCWSSATPDIVWISSTIDDPALERWVTLHEIGHVLHARLGITGSECAADMFARSMLGDPPTAADWNC